VAAVVLLPAALLLPVAVVAVTANQMAQECRRVAATRLWTLRSPPASSWGWLLGAGGSESVSALLATWE
jgi:hypothetical protein